MLNVGVSGGRTLFVASIQKPYLFIPVAQLLLTLSILPYSMSFFVCSVFRGGILGNSGF
jgi:hypothetical protein